jgi:hypothetical protein
MYLPGNVGEGVSVFTRYDLTATTRPQPVSITHWNFRWRSQRHRGKGNHENAPN